MYRLILLASCLLLLACTPPAEIQILHFGDSHAQVEAKEITLNYNNKKISAEVGGYGAIASLIDSLSTAQTLVLHSGDVFTGTPYFSNYHGQASLKLLNMLPLTAMCLGNHEFDAGLASIDEFIQKANFPILSANIEQAKLNKHILPYVIKEIEGVKVAIIGLTTSAVPQIFFTDWGGTIHPPKPILAKLLADFKKQKIKHIIVLSHLGIETDIQLAKELNGIDVIIGGHSHTLMGDFRGIGWGSRAYPLVVNGAMGRTLIAHAGSKNMALGSLQISFNRRGEITNHGGNVLIPWLGNAWQKINGEKVAYSADSLAEFFSQVKISPANDSLLTRLREPLKKLNELFFTRSPRVYRQARLPQTQHADGTYLANGCQVSPLVAKAYHRQANALDYDVDMAWHNAGGTRSDILAGNLSYGDVMRVLPFESSLVILELSGNDIKLAIEDALTKVYFKNRSGHYPYISGLDYKIEKTGKQVCIHNIQLYIEGGGEVLNLKKKYLIAVNSYMADNYPILKNNSTSRIDTGYIDYEILADYLKADNPSLNLPK